MAQREERESIWSVQKRVRNFYGLLFSFLLVAGAIYLGTQTTTFLAFLPRFGVLVVGVAAVSMVVADILGGIMGIADIVQDWREKRIEAARKEGAERYRQAIERERKRNGDDDSADASSAPPLPPVESIDYR